MSIFVEYFLTVCLLIEITTVNCATFNTSDCYHNGTHFAHGSLVPTMESCLSCKCNTGMLICSLKMCAEILVPPPRGCVLVKASKSCCSYLSCKRNQIFPKNNVRHIPSYYINHVERESIDRAMVENFHQRRSEDDYLDFDQAEVCVENGTVYKSGSAMTSSSLCSYCYCFGGQQKCIKPRCMLGLEGCKAIFVDTNCCPVRYDCSIKTLEHYPRKIKNKHYQRISSNRSEEKHGCTIDGTFVTEGHKFPNSDKLPCHTCYCIGGIKKCALKKCTPDLRGCIPIIPKGQCCPSSYECSHTEEIIGRSYNSRKIDSIDLTNITINNSNKDNKIEVMTTTEKSFFDVLKEELEYFDQDFSNSSENIYNQSLNQNSDIVNDYDDDFGFLDLFLKTENYTDDYIKMTSNLNSNNSSKNPQEISELSNNMNLDQLINNEENDFWENLHEEKLSTTTESAYDFTNIFNENDYTTQKNYDLDTATTATIDNTSQLDDDYEYSSTTIEIDQQTALEETIGNNLKTKNAFNHETLLSQIICNTEKGLESTKETMTKNNETATKNFTILNMTNENSTQSSKTNNDSAITQFVDLSKLPNNQNVEDSISDIEKEFEENNGDAIVQTNFTQNFLIQNISSISLTTIEPPEKHITQTGEFYNNYTELKNSSVFIRSNSDVNHDIEIENGYNYEYKTLPPSLSNVKIIPFLPVDAVPIEKRREHSSTPWDSGDFDLITESSNSYYQPNLYYEDSKDTLNDFKGKITYELNTNRFLAPTKTEGGFVPKKSVADINTYYDSEFPSLQHNLSTLKKFEDTFQNQNQYKKHNFHDFLSKNKIINQNMMEITLSSNSTHNFGNESSELLNDLHESTNHTEIMLQNENITATKHKLRDNPSTNQTNDISFLKNLLTSDYVLSNSKLFESINKEPTENHKNTHNSFTNNIKVNPFEGLPLTQSYPVKPKYTSHNNKETVRNDIDSILAQINKKTNIKNTNSIGAYDIYSSSINNINTVHPQLEQKNEQLIQSPSIKSTFNKSINTTPTAILLAGCNINGQLYRVGRVIAELSDACIECKCTEVGINCANLQCNGNDNFK